MKRNLFLSVLLLLVSWSYAQQRTIRGTVSDATTKEPLMSASVVVKGTTKGVSTDMDGKYSIDVAVGQTLEVSFMGYVTQNVKELPIPMCLCTLLWLMNKKNWKK